MMAKTRFIASTIKQKDAGKESPTIVRGNDTKFVQFGSRHSAKALRKSAIALSHHAWQKNDARNTMN